MIICPDGTSTTVTCNVESNGDGTHTITCPGGGSVVVRDGEQLPSGSIAGTVTRYGLPAISGIKAEVLELDRSALTDDAGRFFLDDIRPGVYRIRFTYPGYAPLELANVLVFGNRVDAGESVLKVGRLIATGDVGWELSPDESKVAVLANHERGALSVVELFRGEAHMVAPDADDPYFLDDRFLVYRTGSDASNVVVYDYLVGSSTVVGSNVHSIAALGGLFLEGETGIRFVRLPGFETTDLPGVGVTYISRDGRYVALADIGWQPLGIFDTTRGELIQPEDPMDAFYAVDPVRGQMAYFREIGDVYWLVVLDPATGWSTSVEPVPGPGAIWWSEDGNLLGYIGTDGIRIHDLEGGTVLGLGITDPWGMSFSPTGRFVFVPTFWGTTVVDRVSGELWSVENGWGWTFTESERWAFVRTWRNVEMLDTTDGSTRWIDSELDQFFPLPGEELFFAAAYGQAFFYDPVTEERTELGEGAKWVPSDDHSRVMFTDPVTGHLSVLDLGTRTTSDLGVKGVASAPAGDHFLAITNMDRLAFGLIGDGAWFPLDEQLVYRDVYRTGFFYQTRDLSRPTDSADLRLFWVPYP
ncbi:hypothetical protein AKJ08_1331 [Vulgatibacter incomptus]|uniref:Carboxypeptidase regulatory-like domain-containing protein n=1 Tax=Vulgatibacter incomptus TaxID=1391653 RepID=A0A0K1PCU4_9BACT|nr:hypothetical protein AKJ08_1331 [Vulgatibacter incomptus]